jgi:hypothetical protein
MCNGQKSFKSSQLSRIRKGYNMTIDDELLLELFKPDYYGNIGKDALIVNIVGTPIIDYKLEESEEVTFWRKSEIEKMTPDITVTLKQESITIAIELENDIKWDFQESLRQLKKYRKKFSDVRIIIPREYKRFAPLYHNERFQVYLWSAKRKWKCFRCGFVNVNESRIPPKCDGKNQNGKSCNANREEFELVGFRRYKD